MTLIKAVDVSSWQSPSVASLDEWIAQGCQLLIIRSYHNAEAALRQITKAWVSVAKQREIWHLPYCWLYRSNDPARQARESIELFAEADGVVPGGIFFDCENYTVNDKIIDKGPTVEQYLAAASEAGRVGARASIIYSNPSWLAAMEGDTGQLSGSSGWIAEYNGHQDLNVTNPLSLDVIGHQYTETPVDWSVIDYEKLAALVSDKPAPGSENCDAYITALRQLRDVTLAPMRNKTLTNKRRLSVMTEADAIFDQFIGPA